MNRLRVKKNTFIFLNTRYAHPSYALSSWNGLCAQFGVLLYRNKRRRITQKLESISINKKYIWRFGFAFSGHLNGVGACRQFFLFFWNQTDSIWFQTFLLEPNRFHNILGVYCMYIIYRLSIHTTHAIFSVQRRFDHRYTLLRVTLLVHFVHQIYQLQVSRNHPKKFF